MTNIYELLGRQEKAKKMLAVILNLIEPVPGTADILAKMERSWWITVALAAGCNPPSQLTIDAVLDFIRKIESRTVAA